jgi:hypothetical protein
LLVECARDVQAAKSSQTFESCAIDGTQLGVQSFSVLVNSFNMALLEAQLLIHPLGPQQRQAAATKQLSVPNQCQQATTTQPPPPPPCLGLQQHHYQQVKPAAAKQNRTLLNRQRDSRTGRCLTDRGTAEPDAA